MCLNVSTCMHASCQHSSLIVSICINVSLTHIVIITGRRLLQRIQSWKTRLACWYWSRSADHNQWAHQCAQCMSLSYLHSTYLPITGIRFLFCCINASLVMMALWTFATICLQFRFSHFLPYITLLFDWSIKSVISFALTASAYSRIWHASWRQRQHSKFTRRAWCTNAASRTWAQYEVASAA